MTTDERPTPGRGRRPTARSITPAAPAEFGCVQVWWGDGKGKTTAAMGMGFRAAGHGYRVHMLQYMKGGADSVADVRGEYNAIAAMPGFTYENTGHYGWHRLNDGSADADHQAKADAAVARTEELLTAASAADLTAPLPLDGAAADGMHMLILDEVLYAVEQELVAPQTVLDLLDAAPDCLELILTGGHTEPTYLRDHADLITAVRKQKHPFDAGVRARQGTEY